MKFSSRAIIIKNNALLLIEFDAESGLHYNFPGGTLEPNESFLDALHREVAEETCAEVCNEQLAFVYEYSPSLSNCRFGKQKSISFLFYCDLEEGSIPTMPKVPDKNQTAVKWILLENLSDIIVLPNLGAKIVQNHRTAHHKINYVHEHELVS